jgi:hypothetical protein
MLPITEASLVSRMRTDGPRVSEDLRTYARTEYNGDGAAVIAASLRARQARHRRTNEGAVRTVLRTLAKVPQSLAAALAAPGGG